MTDSNDGCQFRCMYGRAAFFALFVLVAGCGGRIADDGADATPNVPTEESGTPDYVRCDEKLQPSWAIGCDGAAVDHGEICAALAGVERCSALTNGCEGPSPDEIFLDCDPNFFSRPGAKLGVDIDSSGCVVSIAWSSVDQASVQCAVDRLTAVRFPCTGSTTITTPCKPFH